MATTTPDNIRTPNPTDPYNLVADLAILASDVQTALDRRANLYIGTSTQRTAFTSAPEGTHWQDTNGTSREYVRRAGVWLGLTALHGIVNITISAPGTNTASVSFPAGYFSAAPAIQLTALNATGHTATVSLTAMTITATGFVVRLDRSASVSDFSVQWSAFPTA